MNRPSYYPPQYQAALARQWRYSAKGIAVLGLLGCSSLLASLYVERLAILAAATLAIFLVFAWASVWAIYDTYRYVRIVPYFDRTVGDIDTYTAGRELARYCSKLDAMAVASGQQAISAFGFNDDLRGETLVWHSPSDGLRTVAALMAAVAAQPEEFDDPISIISDLQRLSNALLRANERGRHFCLLLLHGGTTSGQEWEVRQGSAF